MTDQTKGHHTQLWAENDADPAVYVSVADVYDMGGTTAAREGKDAKTYGSKKDNKETDAGGLIDYGTQEYTLRFDPDNPAQAQMKADLLSGKIRKYQLRLQNQAKTARTLTAWVSSIGDEYPIGDWVVFKVTVTINDVEDGVWV